MEENPFQKLTLFTYVKNMIDDFLPTYEVLESNLIKKSRKIFRPVNFLDEYATYNTQKNTVLLRLEQLTHAIPAESQNSGDYRVVCKTYEQYIKMVEARLIILKKLAAKANSQSYPMQEYDSDVRYLNNCAVDFSDSLNTMLTTFRRFLV
jgi:hypothetical protein